MLVSIDGHGPAVSHSSWVAPNAVIAGPVALHEETGIWYSATVRSESESIVVGAHSNVQDSATVHADPGFPVDIGAWVTVGHNAVVHGCTIGEGSLIGAGAVILNGAVIGAECLIAAGALVPQGMSVPPRSLVAGVPAKVRRALTDDEILANRRNTENYCELARLHRAGT